MGDGQEQRLETERREKAANPGGFAGDIQG